MSSVAISAPSTCEIASGDYRPTWEPTFDPDPIDAAFWSGFRLGTEDEDADPPAEMGPRERFHFIAGRLSGWQLSDAGREWIEWLESIAPGPGDDWPDSERIRAVGIFRAGE